MQGWSLAVMAVALLGYAAVSRRLDRTVVTGPMVFVGVGLAFGASGTDWLHPTLNTSLIRAAVEAALTLVLFVDASRIDLARAASRARRARAAARHRAAADDRRRHARRARAASLALFAEALVLAIVLAPTDAALGQAVVTDPRLPSRSARGSTSRAASTTGCACRSCSSRWRSARPRTGATARRAQSHARRGGDRLGRRRRRRSRASLGALAVRYAVRRGSRRRCGSR